MSICNEVCDGIIILKTTGSTAGYMLIKNVQQNDKVYTVCDGLNTKNVNEKEVQANGAYSTSGSLQDYIYPKYTIK